MPPGDSVIARLDCSIKNVFPEHIIRLFVLKQSIYSENTHIYLF